MNFTSPRSKEVVAKNLRDGYWLEATDLNLDGKTDRFGYGLTLGELYWYENPVQSCQLCYLPSRMMC
ncbi:MULTISPECIES: hypothetical protein [Xenorhabdus]|uniref:hypothetical protein n=1 Tax=Xenorhabdus TaxID=626 RepID=UPI000AAB952F|nr:MULTISPECIES: hypothetical protein [Xenorhabdus]